MSEPQSGLRELVSFVREQAIKDLEPKFVGIPGGPPHVQFERTPTGLVPIKVEPHPRSIQLARITDLVELAKAPPKDLPGGWDGHAAIFLETERVTLVFDMRNRRERAHVELAFSDEMAFFQERCDAPAISIDNLRTAMRLVLTKCGISPVLIEQVSKLEINTQGSFAKQVGRGTESMGQSINQAVASAVTLPDERQTFQVRVYENEDLDIRFPLECILDPDAAHRQWILKPIADSMSELYRSTMDVIEVGRLRKELHETGIPIYRGSVLV
jgi:hypothetical protein